MLVGDYSDSYRFGRLSGRLVCQILTRITHYFVRMHSGDNIFHAPITARHTVFDCIPYRTGSYHIPSSQAPCEFLGELQTAMCLCILIVKSVHYKIQLSYILCKSSLIVS